MGYESGRVAGIDHAAGHGDPDAGRTISDPGAAAGLFGWHSGGGFRASVRQGDRDGPKGVYPINAVDCCVARFEAVATCERISEAYLIPVLEALLHNFPFVIRGFHGDNGSEYINRHVAEVLDKLLIDEHANSRLRRSNDNAQAESKNGSIVGKHIGYSHIPQRLARVVKDLCREHPNPRLNLHRPCLSAETSTDSKRHRRKRYPCQLMMPPTRSSNPSPRPRSTSNRESPCRLWMHSRSPAATTRPWHPKQSRSSCSRESLREHTMQQSWRQAPAHRGGQPLSDVRRRGVIQARRLQ